MTAKKIPVAIAGAGDVAKFLVEELLAAGSFEIFVISRAEREWFIRPDVNLIISDYTTTSILSILDSTAATVLFSFIHDNTSFYNATHISMLEACTLSRACKRFVPSECGGDIDKHPDKPRFYIPTHGAIRESLNSQNTVEWTLLNNGWFMDYFVPTNKTYMKSLGKVWPLDMETWEAVVPGTGNEEIGFTAARDVAKACTKLITADKWDHHTYVLGENTTWNKAIDLVEKYYGRKFNVTYKSIDEIESQMADPNVELEILGKAYMDEWNYSGASSLPYDTVIAQRRRFFEGVHFRRIRDLLDDSKINIIV